MVHRQKQLVQKQCVVSLSSILIPLPLPDTHFAYIFSANHRQVLVYNEDQMKRSEACIGKKA